MLAPACPPAPPAALWVPGREAGRPTCFPFSSPWEPLQPRDRRTRQRRSREAVQELFDIQADCRVWLDNLPPALADSTLAEHLREVCDLDLSMLDAVLPPEGFGRD